MHITIENLTVHIEHPMTALSEAAAPAAAIQRPGSTPAIGAVWPGQGGVYAGVIRSDDVDYHLIVAAGAEHPSLAFGGYGTDVPAARHDRDGFANTEALLSSGQEHPAARWASEVSADDLTDFYLPSRGELRLCWVNVPELFDSKCWYWSSTQFSVRHAWFQDFAGGGQYDGVKDFEGRARAVRRFKVNP